MSADEASDFLLEAEARLSTAVEMIVKALGPDRGEEVAVGLVQDRIRTLSARHKVIRSLALEVVR